MINIKELNFKYKLEYLYNNLNIRILDDEHIVLVGPNGSGKSTFLKLIAKELIPDMGEVYYERDIKVGYLDQYITLNEEMLVSTYLYDIFNDLYELETKMNNLYEKIASEDLMQNDIDRLLNYASNIQDNLINNDFYNIKQKISNVIVGLGLKSDVLKMKIKHLSSGMRSKVILAKLLLEENDIILLDEPTNFLDNTHIIWLENFLNNYEKTFIVVSHNESFLKNICKVVYDLDNKEINKYKGTYNNYLETKEIKNREYDKRFIRQQKEIKEAKEFIEKNITRKSTSSRAKSRRKSLNKIKVLNKRLENLTYSFNFPIKKQTSKEVLNVKDLLIGYNNEALIEELSFTIRNREKVVITGKNGIGKSTLINTILFKLDKISGEINWDINANISYLSQDDFYLTKQTAYEVVNDVYYNLDKTDIYNLLASYGITFEMANRSINTLSGGEQMKIKLALMKNSYGNVLILDEPTNHLDFNAKEALKEALINYEGTLILVSHEKEFYESICDYEISLF